MKNIRVAAASLNQTPLDLKGNVERILSVIEKAYSLNVNILCLPELCLTSFECEDAFFSNKLHEKSLEYVNKIHEAIKQFKNLFCVSVGLPVVINNCLYNASVFLSSESYTKYFILKQNLATEGNYYESRWFKPWIQNQVLKDQNILGGDYKNIFGDFIINVAGIKIGFEICQDAWSVDRPANSLSKNGVDIILNPSASHFSFNKHNTRKQLVVDSSRAFGCTYVYSNMLGYNNGIIFDGDCIIAQSGKLLSRSNILSFDNYSLITAVVDIQKTKTQQLMTGSFKQEHTKEVFNIYGSFKKVEIKDYDNKINFIDIDKYEQFTDALCLGLYDYNRKSHSNGYVISLSGGADSAACSCLVDLMCKKAKLNIKENLTTIYQATNNSSETTKNAAKKLSEFIGNTHYEINVDKIKDLYTLNIENIINKKLDWVQNDIALQNIQARVRSPSAWMLANINNQIFICTSNRSEAAVGYCTIGGDDQGGISLLSGIDKPFILQWLNHLYKEHNYLGLEDIIKQRPTAELRPGNQQLDEEELAPYNVLNEIELAAMRDKKFPKDVLLTIISEFPQYTKDQLKEWTRKFFKLFIKNQWKRNRMATGFHLDDENLDPRSGLRWPVLCGNLEEFLKEMDEVI